MQTHKEWLDNEYQQWVEALNESTVHNFKEHPMVIRMLSLDIQHDWRKELSNQYPVRLISIIDAIGRYKRDADTIEITKYCMRYMYYADVLLNIRPLSISEIGGGVGQFYTILRSLGYKGNYYIYDLPDVRAFQDKYFAEVSNQTGLLLPLEESGKGCDLLVSFYALGEFDDEKKQWYKPIIDAAPHGYMAWNPHSGANDDLSIFDTHDIKITPGIEDGIKIITW